MSVGRPIAFVAAGLAAAIGILAALAPATWADRALESGTSGRLRLAEAAGTVWRGSGRLVLADVGQEPGASASIAGVAVPGRVKWAISPLPLLVGAVRASLSVEGMTEPIRVDGSFRGFRIGAGALSLPAVDLGRLGSPWNTVRPSGLLSLAWDDLRVSAGSFQGRVRIELRDAASAMTPVRPLGSYRIELVGKGSQADVSIATIDGPLQLEGTGTWTNRQGLRMVAEARADESRGRDLRPFLGLIGVRSGDRTVIRIGA